MSDSSKIHWLTRWDPNDGEPSGEACACKIGRSHNGYGEPYPEDAEDGNERASV